MLLLALLQNVSYVRLIYSLVLCKTKQDKSHNNDKLSLYNELLLFIKSANRVLLGQRACHVNFSRCAVNNQCRSMDRARRNWAVGDM